MGNPKMLTANVLFHYRLSDAALDNDTDIMYLSDGKLLSKDDVTHPNSTSVSHKYLHKRKAGKQPLSELLKAALKFAEYDI